ncbi:hypothetical protein KI387_044141 [Taxus chinensis]|uniref:Uncharacterized protein n=1 Tax=Taxus chinensis TaxID=29808 RepID=A0AA38F7D4_TAXCH|nr:hypothetical protein KI387_044141 [Taxus chinensis]
MAPHVHPYIFTLPEPLRAEMPEDYLPQVVSLGHSHHLKLELYESERYKSTLTIQVEKRAKLGPFEGLVKEILHMAGEIRNSFIDHIEYGDEELGWMMARDAVIILEFIGNGCYGNLESPILQQANPYCWNMEAVFNPERKSPLFFPLQADIFKLENQIPIFILEKALAWQTGSESHALERLKMTISSACTKFSPFIHVRDSFHSTTLVQYNNSLDGRHILEYLYNFVVDDHISIPVENNHNGIEPRFTTFQFLHLMNRLIDTPNDVAVLKKYGIIYSSLGSDKEVSNLWNGISTSIWRSANDPINQTIKDVNDYYRSRYGVLLGEFIQEHFSKPWQAASVVEACILLILAFL